MSSVTLGEESQWLFESEVSCLLVACISPVLYLASPSIR